MIFIEDRGSTLFGKTYLPTYLDRIPEPRHQVIFSHLLNLHTMDTDILSYLMADLTITKRIEEEP
jgi:hypothetical protein